MKSKDPSRKLSPSEVLKGKNKLLKEKQKKAIFLQRLKQDLQGINELLQEKEEKIRIYLSL